MFYVLIHNIKIIHSNMYLMSTCSVPFPHSGLFLKSCTHTLSIIYYSYLFSLPKNHFIQEIKTWGGGGGNFFVQHNQRIVSLMSRSREEDFFVKLRIFTTSLIELNPSTTRPTLGVMKFTTLVWYGHALVQEPLFPGHHYFILIF